MTLSRRILKGASLALFMLPPLAQALPPVTIFDGRTGAALEWEQVLAAMDDADVIVIGEAHTDADGHAIQIELLEVAVAKWPELTLSLEEFDRSQQDALDEFGRNELSAEELRAIRAFVNLKVKNNWDDWYLPKLTLARDGGVPMLASNAPLKYSRMVRNHGCDNLPEITAAERALFECPSIPVDPAYRERFAKSFKSSTRGKAGDSLKELDDAQIDVLFRAHRVWDATMADSIVQARRNGADKIVHLVGGFHSAFNGGLIQELEARDPQARVLVIGMVRRSAVRLARNDEGRSDILIYTRTRKLGTD